MAQQPPQAYEKPPSYEAATGLGGAEGSTTPYPVPPGGYAIPAPAAGAYPTQQPPPPGSGTGGTGAMAGVHYPQQQQQQYYGGGGYGVQPGMYGGGPGGMPPPTGPTTYVHPTTTVQPGITSAHMRRRRMLISLGVGFVMLILVINVIRFIIFD